MDPNSLRRLVDPDDWVIAAACRGKKDLFFPPDDDQESRVERKSREGKAKAFCAVCPVRAECLDEALRAGERFGIWGGMTERERRSHLAKTKPTPPPPQDIPASGRPVALPAVVVPGRPVPLD
ncbi:MAG TPA: WhiB family transcriptional regulator [Actinomycetota bacterium]|nr:WhiB family transcriptional regulator [Actinomycetota bacterium]